MRACAKPALRMQSWAFTAQVCVWTYRPYRISCTDVHIGIQTVIQTVVIYGTDVQTVSDSKGFEFIPPNCLRSLRLYSKSQRSEYRSVCQYPRLCNKCIRSVCLDARLCNKMFTVCMHYTPWVGPGAAEPPLPAVSQPSNKLNFPSLGGALQPLPLIRQC